MVSTKKSGRHTASPSRFSASTTRVFEMNSEAWLSVDLMVVPIRSKIVAPSLKLREELPVLEQQWEATARAAEGLERDIGGGKQTVEDQQLAVQKKMLEELKGKGGAVVSIG